MVNEYNKLKTQFNEVISQNDKLNNEIKKIISEQVPKDIEFNNLCDDYEKLKQELQILQNIKTKNNNEIINIEHKNEDIIFGNNNPINIDDNIDEEIKPKEVNVNVESKDRAMTRLKRMKQKQKEEKAKNKVRKSVMVSNIVKKLEEIMAKQGNEEK